MKKLVFAAGMLVIVLLAVPLVQAGFWETEVFVKNSTKDIWMKCQVYHFKIYGMIYLL